VHTSRLLVGVAVCALGLTATTVTAASPVRSAAPVAPSEPSLAVALGRALHAPDVDLRRTGALAVDLRTGRVVFRRNDALALAPASSEKLAVTLAALRVLGPGFRFRTEVAGDGALGDGVWHGDLVLVGAGDPTLSLADLGRLAQSVRASGIRRVSGRILGDEHHFDTRRAAPDWKPSFLGFESAPLSALVVEGVRTTGVNGSAAAAARAFRAALAGRGVRVAGQATTGRARDDAVSLAVDASAPLSRIVREMNRESDNFVAEMIVKELGTTVAARGSTAAGVDIVRTSLAEAGIPLAGVRLADGSGLSLGDRLTTRALVAILENGADDRAIGPTFVDSLAVAGESGTLEHRLARRPTKGRVRAKTGTTDEASALAGFVRDRYVFAILQNGSPVDAWAARLAQDRFVTVLARRASSS
jgi:D-alanyl-D-alanine carboxypeptidase/D-alanyl-D-alanine-endopeptidase (penicillin-binding protein 4)